MRSSSTSPDGPAPRRTSWRWLLAGLASLCLCGAAHALDPGCAMSQYIRDRWGVEKGFPGGPVYAVTQTADGYLWAGTEKGLVRFDGTNFLLISHATTPTLPAGPVLGLTADADGNLWVRLRSPDMLRYREGRFENVLTELERKESGVTATARGRRGELLLSSLVNGTLKYEGGRFVKLASTSERPNFLVISMAETGDGAVWLGTRDAGLFRLSGGGASAVTKNLPDRKINCLLAVGERELWVGTDEGVVRWDGEELTSAGLPPALRDVQALSMTADADANVWVGTSEGLLRINAAGVASTSELEKNAGGAVTTLFEDREGNVWAGTARGIERLRDSVFTTYSVAQGMPSESNGPVYVDAEGRAWFAPAEGGLYRVEGARVARVTAAGLGGEVVYSIAGGGEEVWVGRQRGGLTRLRRRGASFVGETFTRVQGLAQDSVYAVERGRDGTVWAGTLSGGVSRFAGGRFTNYTAADGLASNTVTAILEGADGTVWFATPNGLSAFAGGRWRAYKVQDGLPSEQVNCLYEDSGGALWVGTDEGLAFFDNGRVGLPPSSPAALRGHVLGIAEDASGALWVSTSTHVLRAARDKLLRGGLSEADVREYGPADGLHAVEGVKRHRSVVADARGRVWFSMNRGLSVVDPARLARGHAPALVHIQTASADGNALDLGGAIRIPASHQRITFGFAGLSFAVPERVRFRYMLEGFDAGWSEPVTLREVAYTNLSPGVYRFRVAASNGDGLWDGSEAAVGFVIEPAVWQTWWFRLAFGLSLLCALVVLYRFRLHRLTRRLNVRFEEQLAERTRIAQELHDTLLQGFISASMQLHVVAEQLPADSPAKSPLGRVQRLMMQVIEEGRSAVSGLRSHGGDARDLEQAFSRVRQELALGERVAFRVVVEGRPVPLHPVIRDEVYRIGREALVNAFRHSRAASIEVGVAYAPNRLRVLVSDDGDGIAPEVLTSGREGHWGLSGMRERAERIGARLKVRSRAAAGTEVELTVPGKVAFQTRPRSEKQR